MASGYVVVMYFRLEPRHDFREQESLLSVPYHAVTVIRPIYVPQMQIVIPALFAHMRQMPQVNPSARLAHPVHFQKCFARVMAMVKRIVTMHNVKEVIMIR